MAGDIETIKNVAFLILVVGFHIIMIYIIYRLCDRYEKRKKIKREYLKENYT